MLPPDVSRLPYLFPVPAKPLRSLLDAKAKRGEEFSDDEAALDVMLAIDRDDLRPHRYLAKRWGWSASRAYRTLSELEATAADWRSFGQASGGASVKHPETEVKHGETKTGQNDAVTAASETQVKHPETEAKRYRTDPDLKTQKNQSPPTPPGGAEGGGGDDSAEDEPDPTPYAEVVGHLNDICGTGYRPTSKKTQGLIRARMAEGFTVDDFRTVHRKKAREWLRTERAQFLRPETLYGTKFESYLNAPEPTPRREPAADDARNRPIETFQRNRAAGLAALGVGPGGMGGPGDA